MRWFHHPITRWIVAILSFIAIVSIGQSLVNVWQKGDIIRDREQALTEEKQKQAELKRQLEEATSSAYIEKVARNKLGLVKEGDVVVLMNPIQNAGVSGQGTVNALELPVWKQWWRLFF